MLPVVTEEILSTTMTEIFRDMVAFRKQMIHYVKTENPEINSAILAASQETEMDPKAIALGAYITYNLLEKAAKEQDKFLNALQ